MIKYSSCTIFFLILLISPSLLAKKILVEADYVFHISSDISGKEACEGAEQKVREKAIREVAGETLNQKLIELCQFTEDADECIIHERTIRSLGRAKITYWEEIERKLMRLPSLDKKARRLQRLMVGHATELDVDGHGRILLSRELREFAGLERQAVLLGQGNRFELWDEGRWNETRDGWLSDGGDLDLSAQLETLTL